MAKSMTGEYYTKCEDMPLYNYIRCQVYNDMSYMVISGKPEQDELLKAWANISDEFYGLAERSIDAYSLTVYFEVMELENKIEVIKNILEILPDFECPDLFDILEDMGYVCERDWTNPEAYFKSLQRAGKRAKLLIVQYTQKLKELDKISKASNSKKASVASYDNTLSILSKHNGYFLDPKILTVSRYAAVLNEYMIYADSKKQSDGGKG